MAYDYFPQIRSTWAFDRTRFQKKLFIHSYEAMKSTVIMQRDSPQERLGLGVAIESNEADNR